MAIGAIAKEIVAKLKLDSKEFTSKLGDTEKGILKFTATATAMGVAVFAMTKATADYRGSIIDAARATGTTTQDFTALKYAADIAQVEIGTLSKALKALNSPSLEVQESFKKYGISLTNVNGKTKTQYELMESVADKIKQLEKPTQKAALATEIFGKKGQGVINMLNNGSDELKKFKEEAIAMGLIFSDDAGAAAEDFSDNLKKIKLSLSGLVQQTTGSVIEFVNQYKIFETIYGMVQKVTQAWMGLDKETKTIIITAGALITGISAIVLGLGGVVAAASFVGPALLSAFPIAAIVAGVTLIAVTTYKYFDQIKEALIPIQAEWEDLKSIFNDIKLSILSALSPIKELVTPIVDFFKNLVSNTDTSGKSIAILGTIVKTIFSNIASIVTIALTPFKVLYEIISMNIEVISKLGDAASEAFSGNFDNASEIAKGALERIRFGAEQVKNNLIDAGDAASKIGKVQFVFDEKPVINKLKEVKKTIDNTINPKGQEGVYIFLGVKVNPTISKEILALSAGMKATSDRFSELGTVIENTWGKAADYISQKMQQALARTNRNFAVFAGKYAEQADKLQKETEKQEDEKLKTLEEKYDEQIEALKRLEDRKLATISNAARERLLAQDEEYQKEKKLREEQFENYIEAERERFEIEKELLLEKAVDKEQRQLVETIMNEDFKLYIENKQKEHDAAMIQFAKTYDIQKAAIETDEKNNTLLTQNEIKAETERLQKEKNIALEQAEKEKNDRLAALEQKRFEDEKYLKKMEALTNWKAEKAQLENTKALKITQTVIGGIAGAAGAFAMAASTIPVIGPIIGAILAASVLAATAISVAQLSSQVIPAPAALFLATGGVVSGKPHSQGGISANLEGGEGVLDRERTQKFIDAADKGMGSTFNFYIQDGAIRNEGKDIDDRTMNKLSYKLAQLLERQGVYA